MSRPYQHLLRSEIAEALLGNQAERDHLQAIIDELQSELDAVRGNGIESLKRKMPLNHQITELTHQVIALLKIVQDFNFEIHVRDSPDLVAQFGPGAD